VNERRKPQPRLSSGEARPGWRGPVGERQPIGMPRYSAESRSKPRSTRPGSRNRRRCGTRAPARHAPARRHIRTARRLRSVQARRCARRRRFAASCARTVRPWCLPRLSAADCAPCSTTLDQPAPATKANRRAGTGLLRAASNPAPRSMSRSTRSSHRPRAAMNSSMASHRPVVAELLDQGPGDSRKTASASTMPLRLSAVRVPFARETPGTSRTRKISDLSRSSARAHSEPRSHVRHCATAARMSSSV